MVPAHRPRPAVALLAAALLPLAAALPARAEEPVRLLRPTAVRGTVAVEYAQLALLSTAPGDAFAGLTLSRQLGPRLALEATVGHGGDGRGRDGRERDGLHLGGGARFTLTDQPVIGITVGLGLLRAQLKDYGGITFAHADAAVELRAPMGLALLGGAGLSLPMGESNAVPAVCANTEWPCQDHFGGTLGLRLFAEAGWSF